MEGGVPAEAVGDIRRGVIGLAHRIRLERPSGSLSTNKVAVLAYLYRNGPSTPGQVALGERQHPQTLTRVFAELETDALITRVRSEQDRRAWVLHLTAEGRTALARDMADRDAWLTAALAPLTDAEVQLVRIAAALMDQIAGG